MTLNDDDHTTTTTTSRRRRRGRSSSSCNSNSTSMSMMMNQIFVIRMIVVSILLLLLVFIFVSMILLTTTTTKTLARTATKVLLNSNSNNRTKNITTSRYNNNNNYSNTTKINTVLPSIEQTVVVDHEEDEEKEEKYFYNNNNNNNHYNNNNNQNQNHIYPYKHIIDSIRIQQQQQQVEEDDKEQQQPPKQRHYEQQHYRYLKSLIHPKLGSILTNVMNTYNNQNQNNQNQNQQNHILPVANLTATMSTFLNNNNNNTAYNMYNNNNNNNHNTNESTTSTTSNSNSKRIDDDYKTTTTTTNNNNGIVTIINQNQILVDVVIRVNDAITRNSNNNHNRNTKLILTTVLQLDGFTVNIDAIDTTTTTDTSDDGSVTIINCYMSLCSMYISMDVLFNFVELEYIQSIRPVMVQTNSGTIQTEGDIALYTNIVRDKYDVNGTDIIIGILSDSFDCKNGSAIDIINGNLPSDPNLIKIVKDLNRNTECDQYEAKDEGRAMMQILHDIAPNAKLVFYTGVRGKADFITGIMELVNNENCTILIDDIQFIDEPFFQDGIITQTIDNIIQNQNILYFTSMGNVGSRFGL